MLCEDEKSQQENHWKCIRSKQRQENKKMEGIPKSGRGGGGSSTIWIRPFTPGFPGPTPTNCSCNLQRERKSDYVFAPLI